MICRTYGINELKDYKYVVTLSVYEGRLLLSRHRERSTWEAQGGHIEPGETPLQAARRELFEESGATDFTIAPLCDYRTEEENTSQHSPHGMVFTAHIRKLGPLPESEMEEVQTFDSLPSNLTYPDILPALIERWKRRINR